MLQPQGVRLWRKPSSLMDELIPAISNLENLGLALGIGLLIGAERERSNAALPAPLQAFEPSPSVHWPVQWL